MFNFASFEQVAWCNKQVEGSPLLPRDVFTMMMFARLYAFKLANGREIWPLTSRIDVSEALDVLGAQPGDTLIRTTDGWATQPGGGGGGGGMTVALVNLSGGNIGYVSGLRSCPFNNQPLGPTTWYDTATRKFTPDLPGVYLHIGRFGTTGADLTFTELHKNGSRIMYTSTVRGNIKTGLISVGLVELNGTTDTCESLVFLDGSGQFIGDSDQCWAALIGPLN